MARCTLLALLALAIAPWTAAGQSFTISGRVTVGISALQGVTLSGLPGNPVTNGNGDYTATVPSGFSATVTPTMSGYAFTPATRTYSNVTSDQVAQNYSGTLQSFTISGRITVGVSALQGVTLSGLPGNPTTNANGDYTATVTSGFSGTVTPTLSGYAFTPASRTYTNVTVNQTAQNYSGALQSFTVSGRVTVGLVGLQGVMLSGLPGSPVTDVNGNYSVTVGSGFSATVTPTLNGYAFTPASRTYTNVTVNQTAQNYSGAVQSLTISGRVTSGVVALQGVTLSGLPGSPVTDANGNYSVTVSSGFSATVTPSKAGYAFTPASRTYSNVTVNQTAQNYSGSLQSLTISGRVTVGLVGLQGVTISGLPGSPVTDVNGNYSAAVSSGFSGTATPAMNGYTFTPANRTYTSIASNQTGQDYSGTASACPTWYHDADGDGYGNPADSLVSCTQPPGGYVSDNTDCNDQNAAIHPGATEICGNGVDDDCVGGDAPCGGTWYRDADGDGYGNPAIITTSVSPPAGYVSDHTDCNDNRSDVHPGLAEVCGDGVDNNCNGQVDEGCANSSPPPPTDTDHDGVPDGTDVCPGTAAGAAVDAKGCSAGQRDSDGDGVTDQLDQCPGTPTGTHVDANGCLVLAFSGTSQLDDDADGVANGADRCPGTPAGTAVDNEGCALLTPAGSAPAHSAATCGGGAAVGMVGIMTGLSLMQRRRPRRV